MTITQLQLYNGALRILGESRLAELTDPVSQRYILDDIWNEDTIKHCLEQGQWSFATRTKKLDYLTSVTPAFGYTRAFEEPEDSVRMVMISDSEYFQEPLTQFMYENRYFFADLDNIYVRYVSDDDLYGRNLGLWPMNFTKFVQSYMAFEAGSRITGVKVDVERLEMIMDKRLKKALSIDGMSKPTVFMPKGAWNHARHGFYGGHNQERR